MKFGSQTIPGSLFKLARDRMLERGAFTPEELKQDLITLGQKDMQGISSIAINHRIIAERVMRSAIKELVASGELTQLKRGLWVKPSIANA